MKPVCIRLPEEVIAQIDAQVGRYGRSAYIRRALEGEAKRHTSTAEVVPERHTSAPDNPQRHTPQQHSGRHLRSYKMGADFCTKCDQRVDASHWR